MTYNFVIIENKVKSEYLNFYSEEAFFEKLWEWTYEDDLWDFIEEDNPDREYLIHYIDDVFIDENIFHEYEEDKTDCYAFKVTDKGEVITYNWNQPLEDFVMKKIKLKYPNHKFYEV